LFPLCLEDLIPADHACRVIDAFVDSLAMEALGFVRSQPASTGRPGYDPRDLLKLYLYGYLQQVRSSRRLETECRRNVEVMWLLGRLVPDHKVIAEFRRLHREAVAEAGASLIRWARAQAMLASGWVAIDGSKFRSVSSTRSVAAAREAMQRYLAGLDEADEAPPAHPEPEARLMRSVQEGHVAAYNVQTAVDATTGLIVAHKVTTKPPTTGRCCRWRTRRVPSWLARNCMWWPMPATRTVSRPGLVKTRALSPTCLPIAASITGATVLCTTGVRLLTRKSRTPCAVQQATPWRANRPTAETAW
jgi:transposase